jgi:hypothetical protein
MKKCPFCAEDIQDAAIKCKHCGEFLNQDARTSASGKKRQWYFSTSFSVLAVGCVGPLALPLIWWRPQTQWPWKIGLTVVILVLSWFLFDATVKSLASLKEYYQLMDTF